MELRKCSPGHQWRREPPVRRRQQQPPPSSSSTSRKSVPGCQSQITVPFSLLILLRHICQCQVTVPCHCHVSGCQVTVPLPRTLQLVPCHVSKARDEGRNERHRVAWSGGRLCKGGPTPAERQAVVLAHVPHCARGGVIRNIHSVRHSAKPSAAVSSRAVHRSDSFQKR